jgi:hypothetical protein
MGENPPEAGTCCLPAADGITYLRVGTRQVTVGIQGMGTILQQLYAMGRKPDETSDEELIGMARRHNYISRNADVEADYAAAFRKAYVGYYARQEKARGQAE